MTVKHILNIQEVSIENKKSKVTIDNPIDIVPKHFTKFITKFVAS